MLLRCSFLSILFGILFMVAIFKEPTCLEFETIEKGFFSGITKQKNLTIRTQNEWNKLWDSHTSTRIPHPKIPVIDFTKNMVLAVFMGQRRTGGFAVEIKKIEKYRSELVVLFTETEPASKAAVTAVLTQPYHIVKIRKVNLPVKFKKIGESQDEN